MNTNNINNNNNNKNIINNNNYNDSNIKNENKDFFRWRAPALGHFRGRIGAEGVPAHRQHAHPGLLEFDILLFMVHYK